MFEIIIVEDNKQFNEQIYKIINSFQIQNKLKYKISRFYDYNDELEKNIKSDDFYKIYILDIELSTLNGIQIANKIRKLGSDCPIIIITSHKVEYQDQLLSEKIMFSKFIHKEEKDWMEQLKEELRYLILPKVRKRILRINTREAYIQLQINKIIYIDYNDRQCKIVTKSSDVLVSRTLTEILNSLDERFMYCFKSKVINTDLIEKIDKKNRSIYLEDNIVIDKVSEKYLKDILNYINKKDL